MTRSRMVAVETKRIDRLKCNYGEEMPGPAEKLDGDRKRKKFQPGEQ